MSTLQSAIDYYKGFYRSLGFELKQGNIHHLFVPNVSANEQQFFLGNDIWILTSDQLSLSPDTELFISSDLDHLISTVGEFNCMGEGRHVVLKGEVNIGFFSRDEEDVSMFFDFLVLSPYRQDTVRQVKNSCNCGCG